MLPVATPVRLSRQIANSSVRLLRADRCGRAQPDALQYDHSVFNCKLIFKLVELVVEVHWGQV